MIQYFRPHGAGLAPATGPGEESTSVWIDLKDPDRATIDRIEEEIGAELPTLADMQEIEASSRLYIENGVGFLTATVPYGFEDNDGQLAPVAFVVTPTRLVTIRHHEHKAFLAFPTRASQAAAGCASANGVLLGLLDAITDRIADILERCARDIDGLSRSIFRPSESPQAKSRDFQKLLEMIGQRGDTVSKLRESLSSLERLFGFLGQVTLNAKAPRDVRQYVKTLTRDTHSMIEYAEFLSQKITLLLDASLGMISIEQSGIIKIFSVVAVVFLPPTLIASIYGMNFAVMPELALSYGYPLAIVLMIISAILPYLFFKNRGWL